MRFASQGKGDYAARQLALLRNSFGGHAVTESGHPAPMGRVRDGRTASKKKKP